MIRLLVIVEGQTEENFVNRVLAPHLYNKGFIAVSARLIGNSRKRDRRGGIKRWPGVRKEIIQHLNTDKNIYVSMMVDYYALPGGEDNPNAWPGRFQARSLNFANKAKHIEAELQQNLANYSPQLFKTERFIPYIIMHEFEGLLFSNCKEFARSINREDLATAFQNIRDDYSSPEEINDSPQTHPSQRIKDLMPEYQKPTDGKRAASNIGLETFRKECPGFRRWLKRIEAII